MVTITGYGQAQHRIAVSRGNRHDLIFAGNASDVVATPQILKRRLRRSVPKHEILQIWRMSGTEKREQHDENAQQDFLKTLLALQGLPQK